LANAGTATTTAARIAVLLLGEWATLRSNQEKLQVGSATIVRCPDEPGLLKHIALELSPSWLVLGEGLPEDRLTALATVARLVAPRLRLAVLGRIDDVDRYDRWLDRGASVYLQPTVPPAQAIRVLLLADDVSVVVIDESLPRLRVARQAQLRLNLMVQASDLTKRERQVLHLMRLGLRNSAIGIALKLSENAVEFHVSNILSKLGAENRTDAAQRANALGL
jgi:DNA-binding NarL/FixJ family response regulator